MWRIPGLAALGLLCLGVAAALLARSAQAAPERGSPAASPAPWARAEPGPGSGGRPSRWPGGSRALRLAGAGVLLAALALTLSLYLSDFYVRRARAEIGRSPQAQLAAARAAARLDPWSTDALYLQAGALESIGERAAAAAQLAAAQRLEPASAVPLGLLGDFQARAGDYGAARRYYRRALALDPLDTGLQQLARGGGRPAGGA
jgi:tetratricopeptide (TPR) repeat protein